MWSLDWIVMHFETSCMWHLEWPMTWLWTEVRRKIFKWAKSSCNWKKIVEGLSILSVSSLMFYITNFMYKILIFIFKGRILRKEIVSILFCVFKTRTKSAWIIKFPLLTPENPKYFCFSLVNMIKRIVLEELLSFLTSPSVLQ